jgi:hypothetical protein
MREREKNKDRERRQTEQMRVGLTFKIERKRGGRRGREKTDRAGESGIDL